MSTYIVLAYAEYTVQLEVSESGVEDDYATKAELVRPYRFMLASDIELARTSMQAACPTKVHIKHSIKADNRAQLLKDALKMYFKDKHVHDDWYLLNREDVTFIESLNEENYFNEVPALVKRILQRERPESAKEAAKAKRAQKEPMSIQELEALRDKLLKEIGETKASMFVCKRS